VNFSEASGEDDSVDAGALRIEFFELLFLEFRKRSLEGMVLCFVIGHSLLNGGPGFYVFQDWVFEHISGRTDPEHIMGIINKDMIPRHAGSVNLLNLIDALDSAENQEDLDRSVDTHIEIINCSRWDPAKNITLENKGVLIGELLYDELVRKRQSQIQSIREGMQAVGLLAYITNNPDICKQIFVAQKSMNLDSFTAVLENDELAGEEYVNKQAYGFFQSLIVEATPDTLTAILRFATGFESIPPWGLRRPIVIRYLDDDEKKIYPEAMACFNILQLPTVHGNAKSFKEHFMKALSIEGIGFSASF